MFVDALTIAPPAAFISCNITLEFYTSATTCSIVTSAFLASPKNTSTLFQNLFMVLLLWGCWILGRFIIRNDDVYHLFNDIA